MERQRGDQGRGGSSRDTLEAHGNTKERRGSASRYDILWSMIQRPGVEELPSDDSKTPELSDVDSADSDLDMEFDLDKHSQSLEQRELEAEESQEVKTGPRLITYQPFPDEEDLVLGGRPKGLPRDWLKVPTDTSGRRLSIGKGMFNRLLQKFSSGSDTEPTKYRKTSMTDQSRSPSLTDLDIARDTPRRKSEGDQAHPQQSHKKPETSLKRRTKDRLKSLISFVASFVSHLASIVSNLSSSFTSRFSSSVVSPFSSFASRFSSSVTSPFSSLASRFSSFASPFSSFASPFPSVASQHLNRKTVLDSFRLLALLTITLSLAFFAFILLTSYSLFQFCSQFSFFFFISPYVNISGVYFFLSQVSYFFMISMLFSTASSVFIQRFPKEQHPLMIPSVVGPEAVS